MLGGGRGGGLVDRGRKGVRAESTPITGLRSTAEYRLLVAVNLAARFVTTLASNA